MENKQENHKHIKIHKKQSCPDITGKQKLKHKDGGASYSGEKIS